METEMSDTSPHPIQGDEPIPVKQPDGSGATACYIIKPEYIDQLRERIRQLEIERDDYKNAWVATLHGYRIYQVYGSTLWYADNPEGGRIYGPSPMWPLAARAAMNAAKGQSAGKAAEYLEDGK
jgi:hypothetical protein